jgi:hypothetical protein
MPRQLPPELQQRALRMVEQSMPEHSAIRHFGARLGVGSETVARHGRSWDGWPRLPGLERGRPVRQAVWIALGWGLATSCP